MLASLWAITRNSFTEIIRQPIYIILLVAGILLTAVSPYVTMFGMKSGEQLLVDMGLATMLLLGVVLGVVNSSQVIHRQIESRTAGAIMSKPVGRLVFLLGQFLAVTLAMALAIFVLAVVLLLALRMGVQLAAGVKTDWVAVIGMFGPLILAMLMGGFSNFFYRLNFSSSAVLSGVVLYSLAAVMLFTMTAEGQVAPRYVTFLLAYTRNIHQVALAALLVFFAVWVLSSFAVAVSTRANTVLSAIITVTAFFVFLVAQFLLSPVSTIRARIPLAEREEDTTVNMSVLRQSLRESNWALQENLKDVNVVRETRQEIVWMREGREATIREVYNREIQLEPESQESKRTVVEMHLERYRDPQGVEMPAEEMVVDALNAAGFVESVDYRRSEIQVWPDYPVIGRIIPHLYVFWVSDKLMSDKPVIPPKYVGMAGLYALGNCLGLLALAAYLFEGRDLV